MPRVHRTDLSVGDAKRTILEMDGARNHAHTLGTWTDAPSVEMEARISKTLEIEMSKLAVRWKRVSVGDINVYVPWNVPIEVLG